MAQALVEGRHGDPCRWLGRHPDTDGGGAVYRTLQPHAVQAWLVRTDTGERIPMERTHPDGLFEARIPAVDPFPYCFRLADTGGHGWETEDPYRFPLQITDFDLYLFGEGTHYRTYERMGAHEVTLDGVPGVRFAVWAPNARRVSVVGPFNRWDGRVHPMQNRGGSGLWEIFLPGLQSGDLYKYEVRGPGGDLHLKADPYGFSAELRPKSASVVCDVGRFAWGDGDWMARRAGTDWLKRPILVYEAHLGSWGRAPDDPDRWLTYREMAERLVPYVKGLGYTHLELLPVTEHPFDASWGYQTTGFFAPTSRFGTPADFAALVDACHQAGLGVILDWVPAHFPRDAHGLARFDGTHLYEHADPRQGEHRDWGTLIFNYGRREVQSFLLSSAVFWADVYHVDGLRVDAVASMLYLDYSRKEGEWIPNRHGGRENLEAIEFLKAFNRIVHAEIPGFLTFAEESTAWPMVTRPVHLGGLGFDLKWNMGWMNDILSYFQLDPVHRKYHHPNLTFSMIYAFTENFILPFSHDEVVHGKGSLLNKMPGDSWQKFANLRLLFAYLAAHPGKKLLFMGQEFGSWSEWNCSVGLDWSLLEHEPHRGLRDLVGDLNRLVASDPALHAEDFRWEGFEWVELHDADQSTLSFLRKGDRPEDRLLCVFNFTPVPRTGFRVGVPRAGGYVETLNTDAACYGGGNLGNSGFVQAEPLPWNGKPHSLRITLPPLAALYFRPENPGPD
jgi:1,4-alpha-glucan branching enzyme